MADFKVYLNRKKTQWVDVFLWDVHPTTFANWGGGRWGYYYPQWETPNSPYFGDVHFVKRRIRPSLVSHEFNHALYDWLWARRIAIQSSNEEWVISIHDRLMDGFYLEWNKLTRNQK